MEVTFQLTADDFRHGMIAVRKRSRWRRWTYWFGFAVVVPIIIFGVTLLVAYPHSEIRQDSWIMLGGSVFWMVFIRTLPRLSARMQFRRTPSDDYRNLGVWAARTVSSWRFSSRLVGVHGLGRGGVGLRAPTAAADLPSDSQTSLHRAATSRIPRGTAPQHTTSQKNVKLNNLPPDAWLA